MRIDIRTIPHAEQRYPTCGDWLESGDGELHIWVSNLSDNRYEMLVAVHELVEALLCRAAGITSATVDAFDLTWQPPKSSAGVCGELSGSSDAEEPDWPFDPLAGLGGAPEAITEPGDDPQAPYHRQHLAASEIERRLAHLLGVEWDAYERALEELGK